MFRHLLIGLYLIVPALAGPATQTATAPLPTVVPTPATRPEKTPFSPPATHPIPTLVSTPPATTQPVANKEVASNSPSADALVRRVEPSLVAVQYTWESEMGRQELIGAGVVVSADGLVMTSIGLFDLRIPDDQMKDFKIVIPRHDTENEELDAVFVGRDERTNLAFVKAKAPAPAMPASDPLAPATPTAPAPTSATSSKGRQPTPRRWTPLTFAPTPFAIGQPLVSIGLLPKSEGYGAYAVQGHVAATLRGEIPHVAVDSGLAAMGSPVFNPAGQAVGLVNIQQGHNAFLNASNVIERLQTQPHFFVPASDFIWSLSDLPTAGEPMKLPWMGVVQLTGLNKDVAEAYGLGDRPVIEVGDVIANAPAAKAGLKAGDKIVTLDGAPLPRGDTPEDLPGIMRRLILRKKVGAEVVLGVVRAPNAAPVRIAFKLDEQPMRPSLAERFFAEDLGFTARRMVFSDTYLRRLPADAKGVVVSFVKPQGAAQTAALAMNDVILSINREPVENLGQFKASYQRVRKTSPKDPVVLVVLRDNQTQTLRIETPQEK